MFYKTTKSLFQGKYQYKIVMVSSDSSIFRSGDASEILEKLKKPQKISHKIKSGDDIKFNIKLATQLSKMQDFDLRVESPWISIYTNNKDDIVLLQNINSDVVKYISLPDPASTLESGVVVMPKTPFDYRITLGKTTKSHPEFVEWATALDKLKLTKSCIRALQNPRSWGGTHFYVKGDNVLLMAKMHLGGSISKIDRIIKPHVKA